MLASQITTTNGSVFFIFLVLLDIRKYVQVRLIQPFELEVCFLLLMCCIAIILIIFISV